MLKKIKFKKVLFSLLLSTACLLFIANIIVTNYSNATTNAVKDLPQVYACLVLGTSKTLSNGAQNLFYVYRMNAAIEVYVSGKCKRIIVSGDNRHSNYNEPDEMKKSLILKGIPPSVIFCDYAGGRTLDSIIRFKEIFGQNAGIVISQQFHNERAIYIASHNGIALNGYNAQEVNAYNAFKTKFREVFSRALVILDVQIFHTKARHYGEKVVI
ncbi:MAG: ElyC/SanA/YdcF family protein [Pseudomonadota bacterium]